MIEVKVNPGICGMETCINVESEDMQTARIKIDSDCQFIRAVAAELQEIDAYTECFAKLGDSQIYALANKYCKHPGCPIPPAIIKGVEVACGLALPKDVEIKINKK